jgi:hypothetical protein
LSLDEDIKSHGQSHWWFHSVSSNSTMNFLYDLQQIKFCTSKCDLISVEICGFMFLKYIPWKYIIKNKNKTDEGNRFYKEDIPKMKESKLLLGMYS